MISDSLRMFREAASACPDYEKKTPNELGNGYCDAEEAGDIVLRDGFFAALVLRYWYKIYKYAASSKSTRLELEDFLDWLIEAISLALKYRRWRDPSNKLFKDKNAVDKVINCCCATVRNFYYQAFNKDKRKLNYLTASLETQIENAGDAAIFENSFTEEPDAAAEFINSYVQKDKLISAIILDNIAYFDAFKEKEFTRTVTSLNAEEEPEQIKQKYVERTFDVGLLVKNLKKLNEGYFLGFMQRYHLSEAKMVSIEKGWKKLSKDQLTKEVNNTLLTARASAREFLC